MKKTKQPGENISLKTRKTEDPAIMNWINAQSNLMDSLRFLIEQEVARHGVRNLQAVIPSARNVDLRTAVYAGLAQSELAAGMEPDAAEPGDLLEEDEIDDADIESWI